MDLKYYITAEKGLWWNWPYQAALLETIVQWPFIDNKDSWIWEQEGVATPLGERILCLRLSCFEIS